MRLPFFQRRGGADANTTRWPLTMPLLRWSDDDAWTLADAVAGCLVTGATGSGKSSGSGKAIATAFLRSGFGGLILVTKPDECSMWREYARQCGREGDLKVFGADAGLRFNFLDYEATRSGEGAGLTENLLNVFSNVLEVADRGTGNGGRDDEGYWRRATRQLIRNSIQALLLSRGRLGVPELYKIVISAPTSPAQKRSAEWQAQSLCYQCLAQADMWDKAPRDKDDLTVVVDYFLSEYPALSEKTRSVIVSTFTSTADVLMRGLLRDLFCADTNITPEAIAEGTILVIDLPVKTFGEVGIFAQVLWKYAFQRAIERRDTVKNPRPVFLFADEAQHFITSYDMQFQTTCRSSRVATVYLTQNVSNVYSALGGEQKGSVEAASLFANLNTKVMHANGDPVTNEWAASVIGMSRQFLANASTSYSGDGSWPFALGIEALSQPSTASAGFNEQWLHEVPPSAFTQLKTGGPQNGRQVEGIVFQNGRRFQRTGKTWISVNFKQTP